MKTHRKRKVVLFIMDAPNVDMSLSDILERRTQRTDRPDYAALLVWLKLRTRRDQVLFAKVFVNHAVDPRSITRQRRWTEALRKLGYDVFLKKREPGNEDVDYDMIMFLRHVRMHHNLIEVIIASNDGRCFLEDLEIVAQEGTRVVVLGFEQRPSVLTRHEAFEFIPLPSVPGVMPQPVP